MTRCLKIFLIGLGFATIALLTLPWWLGAMGRPVLRVWDISFGHYERIGYARFKIDEVKFTRLGLTVTVNELEAPTPLLWLRTAAREASAQSWRVEVTPAATPAASPARVDGWPALHRTVAKILRTLARRLPSFSTGPGVVDWGRGRLTLAEARWAEDKLTVKRLNLMGPTFDLAAQLTGETIALVVTDVGDDLRGQLQWTATALTGQLAVWAQPASLNAQFAPTGWIPGTATLIAEQWDLPAQRGRLEALYSRLTGSGRLEWQDRAFTLTAEAKASPLEGIKTPPLVAKIAVAGDHRAFTINALQIDAPFAEAKLTAPVIFGFDGATRGAPARLTFKADLAQLPWFEAGGRAEGTITVSGEPTALRQDLAFTLADLVWRDFTLSKATARGVMQWPRLELSSLELQLDETSRLTAQGALDWSTRELQAVALTGTVQPGWFARWLPADTQWQDATVAAILSGPVDAPQHSGQLELTAFQTGLLKPVNLAVVWEGRGELLGNFSATAATENSTLQFAGTGRDGGLILSEASLTADGDERLKLTTPARISWAPHFELSGLELRGTDRVLAITASSGEAPAFTLVAKNIESTWPAAWVELRGPAWHVTGLAASGQTGADGVLAFSLGLTGEIRLPEQTSEVEVAATGDAQGVRLTALMVMEEKRVLTQATGRLPLRFMPRGTPRWQFDDSAALELLATSERDSPLWTALAGHVGLELTGATARAELSGTPKAPTGTLEISIASLQAHTGRFAGHLPNVTEFNLQAKAGRQTVQITALTAKVEGQQIRASAELPMDDGRWQGLLKSPGAFSWQDATARVEIPNADLAPLARRLPNFFAAQGTFAALVELTRGGNLQGSLKLSGATTRPLPALGVVQEINAALSLSARTVTVESFSGLLGGEAVTLQGRVTLPPQAEPKVDLTLRGQNLPLVRRAGLLVRSDLDLKALTNAAGVTRVSGRVTLRDGLVLTNLASLLPTGPRGTPRPPPYFAVEAAPFNDWPLAVEVRGRRALRVRTPVFHGTASVNFALGGTLGDPRAVGELTVDDGRIFFPFATFTLQGGSIQLRDADPYRPQLNLNAISRRQNYELRLALTGSPETPSLVFSSNPPLEPSEVLLLVMTGKSPSDPSTNGTGGVRLTQFGAYLGRGIFRSLGGVNDAQRLEVASGEQISQQGRETYEISYRLGERWSLIGEYDEFDSYNAAVKWHVYKQEGTDEIK